MARYTHQTTNIDGVMIPLTTGEADALATVGAKVVPIIIIAEQSISPLERVITALETNTLNAEATKAMLLLDAAPDLLAALEHAANWAIGFAGPGGQMPVWYAQARAAIAKATGND